MLLSLWHAEPLMNLSWPGKHNMDEDPVNGSAGVRGLAAPSALPNAVLCHLAEQDAAREVHIAPDGQAESHAAGQRQEQI